MRSTTNNKSFFIKYLLSSEIIAHADARKLIELAEFAVSLRAWDELAQIGSRLCEIPVSAGYFDVGLLYGALALNRIPGGRAQAEGILQGIIESGNDALKARALLALGSNHLVEGDSNKALELYQRANQLDSTSPLTIFYTAIMTISAESRHRKSLDALNGISKLAEYIGRFYRPCLYIYRNAVAVELNKTGHSDEAKRVLRPALESPIAHAYQEWSETDQEIDQSLTTGNVVSINSGNYKLSIAGKRQECLKRITYGSDALIERVYPLVAR